MPFKIVAQWVDVSPNILVDFKHIYFADNNIGYVMSDTLLIKTINGGATWSSNLSSTDSLNFISMSFISADTGFVASKNRNTGGVDVLFKTIDGGLNWAIVGDGDVFQSIHFLNGQIGFASRSYWADIWMTNNGGITWNARVSPIATTLLSKKILFLDTIFSGYVLDSFGKLWEFNKTANFDYNYTFCNSSSSSFYNSIDVFDNNLIYSVGDSGIIHKKTGICGTSWIQQAGVFTKDNFGVQFLNQDTGLVVGADGQIQITTDGGASWVGQTSNTTDTLRNVVFIDENTAYAIGDNGTIIKNTSIVGVNNLHKDNHLISIFPNPSNGNTTISFNTELFTLDLSIEIYSTQGKLVTQFNTKNQSKIILKENSLKKGMYFIFITTKEKTISTHKLVIQ